jgi:hypothetical protein
MKHRTGCAALRHTGSGNSRSLESARRTGRRDSAHQAYIHGPILPMEQPRGLIRRLLGL